MLWRPMRGVHAGRQGARGGKRTPGQDGRGPEWERRGTRGQDGGWCQSESHLGQCHLGRASSFSVAGDGTASPACTRCRAGGAREGQRQQHALIAGWGGAGRGGAVSGGGGEVSSRSPELAPTPLPVNGRLDLLKMGGAVEVSGQQLGLQSQQPGGKGAALSSARSSVCQGARGSGRQVVLVAGGRGGAGGWLRGPPAEP